jgi:RHS repeat-associated protein
MTLMPSRKPKTPASTGITKHYCLKRQADISVSILPCVTSITQNGKTTTSVYDNANRMTQSVMGNGVAKNFVYDAASQLSSITFKKGTTTIGDLTYSYDNGGQIITQNGSLARTPLPPATTANAIYDANNRLTSWNGQAISYDAQGNMLAIGGKTFTWDTRNRLASITGGTTASFSYDAADRRISKAVPITTNIATQLTYDGANPVVEKQGATVTGTNLTGLGMDSYLTRKDGATETYPLTDHLGSTVALTDAAGAIVTSYTYEPYGATTQTGTASSNPHQYTGRENDGTGLYFYRARYYDPQLMRFISEDPIGLAGGVNSYAYVDGAPMSYSDPDGLRRQKPDPNLPPELGGRAPFIPIEQRAAADRRFRWGDELPIIPVTPGPRCRLVCPSDSNTCSADKGIKRYGLFEECTEVCTAPPFLER